MSKYQYLIEVKILWTDPAGHTTEKIVTLTEFRNLLKEDLLKEPKRRKSERKKK